MYISSATIHTTVMKLGQWVVFDKTFQNMYVKMTLTQMSRSREMKNRENIKMHVFSATIQATVMKLGHQFGTRHLVTCIQYFIMTFMTFGQGHCGQGNWTKVENGQFDMKCAIVFTKLFECHQLKFS